MGIDKLVLNFMRDKRVEIDSGDEDEDSGKSSQEIEVRKTTKTKDKIN